MATDRNRSVLIGAALLGLVGVVGFAAYAWTAWFAGPEGPRIQRVVPADLDGDDGDEVVVFHYGSSSETKEGTGTIRAEDPETGETIWRRKKMRLPRSGASGGRSVAHVGDQLVLVPEKDAVRPYALEATSGETVWELDLGKDVGVERTGPDFLNVAPGGRVVFQTETPSGRDKLFYLIDAAEGRQIWKKRIRERTGVTWIQFSGARMVGRGETKTHVFELDSGKHHALDAKMPIALEDKLLMFREGYHSPGRELYLWKDGEETAMMQLARKIPVAVSTSALGVTETIGVHEGRLVYTPAPGGTRFVGRPYENDAEGFKWQMPDGFHRAESGMFLGRNHPKHAGFRRIPTRYYPLVLRKEEKLRIAMFDLAKGEPAWMSKPFPIGLESPDSGENVFSRKRIYHGGSYVVPIYPPWKSSYEKPSADRVLLSFDGSTGRLQGAVRLLERSGQPVQVEWVPEQFSRGKYWHGRGQYGYGALDLKTMQVTTGSAYLRAQDLLSRLEEFTGELPSVE